MGKMYNKTSRVIKFYLYVIYVYNYIIHEKHIYIVHGDKRVIFFSLHLKKLQFETHAEDP